MGDLGDFNRDGIARTQIQLGQKSKIDCKVCGLGFACNGVAISVQAQAVAFLRFRHGNFADEPVIRTDTVTPDPVELDHLFTLFVQARIGFQVHRAEWRQGSVAWSKGGRAMGEVDDHLSD